MGKKRTSKGTKGSNRGQRRPGDDTARDGGRRSGSVAAPQLPPTRSRSSLLLELSLILGGLLAVGVATLTTAGTQVDRLIDEVGGVLSGVPGGLYQVSSAPALSPSPPTRSWLSNEGGIAPAPAPAPATRKPCARTPRSRETPRFVSSREDALSTFAMDVDTGSYSLARRWIEARRRPPASTVRPEEFLNAFDYRDPPPPPGSSTFAVTSEVGPSPFHPDRRLLRVGLRAREVDAASRPPVHLTFVVDVSGSMDAPDRLPLVQRSLTMLLRQLRPEDRVALVVYGSDAREVLPSTSVEERFRIELALAGMRIEGATNVAAGLNLAYRVASSPNPASKPPIRRVVLCSDGVANLGPVSPQAILEQVSRYADAGILLTTLGFGMGSYSDSMMEQLADRGDGAYAYVDSLAEAQRVLVEQVDGTLITVARDAKIQVAFDPEVVASYRLVGYENRDVADADFRNDAVDAGEVGAGHGVVALYEYVPAEGTAGAPARPLGSLGVRYQATGSGTPGAVLEERFSLGASPDTAAAAAVTSPSLRLASVLLRLSEYLQGKPWAADLDLEALASEAAALQEAFGESEPVEQLATTISRLETLPRPRLAGGA